MTSAADQVFDAALSLPPDERRRLTEALVEALPEAAEAIEAAWLEAVRRRAEPFQSGNTQPRDAQQALVALEMKIRRLQRR